MSNTLYPGAIDSFYNPTTSDTLATMVHHTQHGGANDAVTALETKLGTGASTASSGAFLVGTGTNASSWVSTLTSPSITTSLLDANNKTWIAVNPAGSSAVNYANIGNSTTGNAVTYGVGGTDSNINVNIVPKGSGKTQDNGTNLIDFRSSFQNFIQTGCIWSIGSGLTGSMTAGTVWINGVEYSVPSVGGHTFGSSVDTYIDYTVGTGVTYTAVSNNSASPSLAANSVRIGIAVSGASLTSFNQGSISVTTPVASSVTYSVADSLGNLIYPTNPNYGLLSYRQITSAFTTSSSTQVQITGLSAPLIAPGNRKLKITIFSPYLDYNGTSFLTVAIWRGVVGSGTQLAFISPETSASAHQYPCNVVAYDYPPAGTVTYNAAFGTTAASSSTFYASTIGAAFLSVEAN